MTNINESKEIKKLMRKDFNKLGITLIMQEIILNGVMIIAGIGIGIMQLAKNPNISDSQFQQIFEDPSFMGTMSIIGVLIAFIPVLIYRRKKFFGYDLKVVNRKFTLKTVIIYSIILLSANSILELFTDGLEFGLNTVGLSAISALDKLDELNKPAISMIIYGCIVAPIIEECIYRGAVLRSLEKYGRKFAIVGSAILFGLMHGNFYQIFMAAGIGIILGYLATEYSIKLTIILHICNNTWVQLLSETTSRISQNTGDIIDISITVIAAIIMVLFFIYSRNHIKEWSRNNIIEKGILIRFFTSITIILVIIADVMMVVSDITKV